MSNRPHIAKQQRDAYWNAFSLNTTSGDFFYHFAGADKPIQGKPEPDLQLYYVYRFAFEQAMLERLLDQWGGNRGRALDCGGGTGRVALVLADHFHAVECFDVSAPMIEENARRFASKKNITFFQSNFSELSAERGMYDFIFVGGVFMCMGDDEVVHALHTLKNMLAPGGILITRDTITPKQTKRKNDIKVYRSEQDYEALFAQAQFTQKRKSNSANRNLWCSVFRRLPKALQRHPAVYRVFEIGVRLTILWNVRMAMKQPFERHHMSNQLFYVFTG